jgi:hypothetical protein
MRSRHGPARCGGTTPATCKWSPKVNFPLRLRFSKVKRVLYNAAKSLYPFQQSGVERAQSICAHQFAEPVLIYALKLTNLHHAPIMSNLRIVWTSCMRSRHGPGTLRRSSPATSINERGGILMKIARALATCEGGGWGTRHLSRL